jgi:phage shock protein PspC (stress-responsive transcriptional regulator)
MGVTIMNGLYRPRDDRMIGGVCAALARRFGVSAGMVRVLAVLSCLLPGPQFVAYIILWAMIPSEEKYAAQRH